MFFLIGDHIMAVSSDIYLVLYKDRRSYRRVERQTIWTLSITHWRLQHRQDVDKNCARVCAKYQNNILTWITCNKVSPKSGVQARGVRRAHQLTLRHLGVSFRKLQTQCLGVLRVKANPLLGRQDSVRLEGHFWASVISDYSNEQSEMLKQQGSEHDHLCSWLIERKQNIYILAAAEPR